MKSEQKKLRTKLKVMLGVQMDFEDFDKLAHISERHGRSKGSQARHYIRNGIQKEKGV